MDDTHLRVCIHNAEHGNMIVMTGISVKYVFKKYIISAQLSPDNKIPIIIIYQ